MLLPEIKRKEKFYQKTTFENSASITLLTNDKPKKKTLILKLTLTILL